MIDLDVYVCAAVWTAAAVVGGVLWWLKRRDKR